MSTEEGTNPPIDDGGANARIRQLVARVKELEAKVGELSPLAESAEKYRSQLDEQKAMTKAEREAMRLERDILAAGITDDEGIEYVQHAFSKLSGENKPTLSEWLSNRDALPKAVRAYLPDAPAAPQQAPTLPSQSAPVTPPMPKMSTAGVQAPPSTPQAWSEQAIKALPPGEFEANYQAIIRSILTP